MVSCVLIVVHALRLRYGAPGGTSSDPDVVVAFEPASLTLPAHAREASILSALQLLTGLYSADNFYRSPLARSEYLDREVSLITFRVPHFQ